MTPNLATKSPSKLPPETLLKDDAFDERVTHEELASEAVSPFGLVFLVVSSRPSPITATSVSLLVSSLLA